MNKKILLMVAAAMLRRPRPVPGWAKARLEKSPRHGEW